MLLEKPKVTLVIKGPNHRWDDDDVLMTLVRKSSSRMTKLVAKEKILCLLTTKTTLLAEKRIDRLMVVTKVHQRVSMTSNALFHLDS